MVSVPETLAQKPPPGWGNPETLGAVLARVLFSMFLPHTLAARWLPSRRSEARAWLWTRIQRRGLGPAAEAPKV